MLQQAADSENGRTSTRLRPGQAVTGTVVQIGQDYVFVDVGTTTEGRIDRRELEDDGENLRVHVGDQIRASVVSADDVLGPRLSVSFGRGGGRARLEDGALESARDARLPVEGVVGAVVKNGVGVEVKVLGARAFCPASQLGTEYIADLASLEGQKLEFLVLEVKNGGRDVIVSRKALLLERQSRAAADTLATLVVGNDYAAKVVSLQKYGAFVDLGGVEGLIHISELTHGRVERVEDVLRIGEEITVRLLALQPGEKGSAPKLRLSLRALGESSASPEVSPERGEVLVGTVSKVTSFGVFVDTAKGTGLVPSRELGTPQGSDSRRSFPLGKEVSVVLVSKDASRGLTFSMSRVAAVEERRNFQEFSRAMTPKPEEDASVGSFGALLQKLKLPTPARPAPTAAAPAAVTPASTATPISAAGPAPAARPAPAAKKPAAFPAPVAPRAPAPTSARAPAPKPAPAPVADKPVASKPAAGKPATADRGNVDRSSRPRGGSPADRARVDRSPASPPGQPATKPVGASDKSAELGVVRGRRRPGSEGGEQ
jgi:small subunit ribosomal protein S1